MNLHCFLRLTKEKLAYEREIETQQVKVAKMKSENREQHDISKQEEVLQESRMMIPDSLRRLKAAVEDLNKVLVSRGFTAVYLFICTANTVVMIVNSTTTTTTGCFLFKGTILFWNNFQIKHF